jgi:hypothetical protein
VAKARWRKEEPMSDIFISHVEEDADVALEIALGLEEAGYSTWCYELDGIPGASYLLQTGQAVANSKAVVVVISPHSVGSRQVTREVVRAHESDRDFIPVRRDISHIEFQNRQPEWREAIGAATSIGIPKEGATSVLPRIIAGVKNLGIQPAVKADSARIQQIYREISELPVPTQVVELEHGPAETAKGTADLAVHVDRPIKGLVNWFERHLNLTMVLAWAGGYVVVSIVGSNLAIRDHYLLDVWVFGIAPIICLIVSIVVGRWVLKKKNRSMWWLFISWTVFFLLISNKSPRRHTG